MVRHYKSVGHTLSIKNIAYEIMKSYNDHFMLVNTAKKDQDMKLPKVQKDINQLWWLQFTGTHRNTFIGHCSALLAYALRIDVVVNVVNLLFSTDRCYLEESNSVQEELIMFLMHKYILSKDDNALILETLEESLRGSSTTQTIQPNKKKKDGQAEFLAVIK